MFKRWGLLAVTAFFLCSCAGVAGTTEATGTTAPADPAAEEPLSARDQELQEYQKLRQVEMQQMMQQRMMQGGVQGGRPVQIGPPGGGGMP